jgi:hypothetical protein
LNYFDRRAVLETGAVLGLQADGGADGSSAGAKDPVDHLRDDLHLAVPIPRVVRIGVLSGRPTIVGGFVERDRVLC